MKKLTLIAITLLSVTVFFSSCKKDENSGPPTLNFIGGEGYVDTDQTLQTGTTFKVGIAASANAESNEKLTSIWLTRTINGSVFIDTTLSINDHQYNVDFEFNAQAAGVVETIAFVVTDKAGQMAEKSLTLTYESAGVPVYKDAGVTMGSHNDINGSFYSTVTTEVYNIADATAAQNIIDFLFYLGATNGSTIASPADTDANTVYAINDWTTKNATLFTKLDMSAAEFDAIGDTFVFPEFTDETSSITHLATNDVLMYKTVNNFVGLIKVNSINGRGDFVSLDVIVTGVAK